MLASDPHEAAVRVPRRCAVGVLDDLHVARQHLQERFLGKLRFAGHQFNRRQPSWRFVDLCLASPRVRTLEAIMKRTAGGAHHPHPGGQRAPFSVFHCTARPWLGWCRILALLDGLEHAAAMPAKGSGSLRSHATPSSTSNHTSP